MARKEHGENYSSQLAALVVSTTSPLTLLILKCILHGARQCSVQMVLPCRSNIHNLVKIVACLVVRSLVLVLHTLDFSCSGLPPLAPVD